MILCFQSRANKRYIWRRSMIVSIVSTYDNMSEKYKDLHKPWQNQTIVKRVLSQLNRGRKNLQHMFRKITINIKQITPNGGAYCIIHRNYAEHSDDLPHHSMNFIDTVWDDLLAKKSCLTPKILYQGDDKCNLRRKATKRKYIERWSDPFLPFVQKASPIGFVGYENSVTENRSRNGGVFIASGT